MSQPKSSAQTFIFATVVCVVCSIVLASASTILRPMQKANEKLDIVINTLSSVGFDVPKLKKMKPEKVFAIYNDEFESLLLDENDQQVEPNTLSEPLFGLGYPKEMLAEMNVGELLRLYNSKKSLISSRQGKPAGNFKQIQMHKKDGKVDAYVIYIEGYGLWDIIKGYIALEPDLATVKGISFFEHKETPGLGARITEDWFKEQFKGKKIRNEDGTLHSITIVKGKASSQPEDQQPYMVDGISGATLTGKGINHFLLEDLQNFEPYFKKLRENN